MSLTLWSECKEARLANRTSHIALRSSMRSSQFARSFSLLQNVDKYTDCLADGAVRCEPVSVVKFPDHQGKYREFPLLKLRRVLIVAKKHRFDGHLASDSLLKLNRELISVEQGVDSGDQ
jgi:hypothetical protein